ncbi:hypothetical protein WUBG_03563 [Wuchereria bancrofti]|nr:hypothetical protein WUBG_03563 [Wuchereria bancrofti]
MCICADNDDDDGLCLARKMNWVKKRTGEGGKHQSLSSSSSLSTLPPILTYIIASKFHINNSFWSTSSSHQQKHHHYHFYYHLPVFNQTKDRVITDKNILLQWYEQDKARRQEP